MSKFILPLVLVFFLAGLSGCGKTPSPHELLDKAVEAHGGRENILKPRLVHLKGTWKHSEGMSDYEEFLDFPNHLKRIEGMLPVGKKGKETFLLKEGKTYARHYDGRFEVRETNAGDHINNSFGLLYILAGIKENAQELTPLGAHRFLGQAYYGIEGLAKDGTGGKFYFSQKTGLLGKVSAKMGPSPDNVKSVHTVFGDYRQVDEVTLPHLWEVYFEDEKKPMSRFQIHEVKILEKIDQEIFSVP